MDPVRARMPACIVRPRPGVVELVSVIAGTLQIELPERTVIVHPGEAARFSADVEHTYENIGDTDCEVYDQIFY